MEEAERQETTERCQMCGHSIPVSNLELHSLRCTQRRSSPNSPQGETAGSQTLAPFRFGLCYIICGIPILVAFLVYVYLCLTWQSDFRLYNVEAKARNHTDRPGFRVFLLDRLMGDAIRRSQLTRVPPSFLPDVWPESAFAWTRVQDNFWATPNGAQTIVMPPLKDRTRLVLEESTLSAEQAQQLKVDLSAMANRLNNLQWKSLPWSRGVCGDTGQQNRQSTLCAVHRWNAYMENHLLGRVQCWTDPSLLYSDPTFVRRNPLFHPALVPSATRSTTDEFFYCVIDVPGYAATLAAMHSLPLLQVNNLLWYCRVDVKPPSVVIRQGDLPVDVVQRDIEPFFLQFLNAFVEDTEEAEREDEGEVIDLDHLEDLSSLSDEL